MTGLSTDKRTIEFRIAGITEESIVDGPGIRFVIFFQGCKHNCKGCHNPETHCLDGGKTISQKEIIKKILDNPLISGITFSGGEPFLQVKNLVPLAEEIKSLNKNLMIYTGYVYEELLRMSEIEPSITKLLDLTDYLVDGPYIEDKRDLSLDFRGSSNQRFIKLR